jgi:hypothetical protein
LGGRRVLVTGTGPMGCVPAELAMRSINGECAPQLQEATALFNPRLSQLINDLNNEIGSDVFIFANAFDMHMDFISDPQAYGTYICQPSKIFCSKRDYKSSFIHLINILTFFFMCLLKFFFNR